MGRVRIRAHFAGWTEPAPTPEEREHFAHQFLCAALAALYEESALTEAEFRRAEAALETPAPGGRAEGGMP